jgi:hypothetical protein
MLGAAPRPDDVREALRRGFAEVGVVATSGPTEALTDLDRLPLDTQSFVLVARHDVNLPAGHDDLKMSDLRGLPLVARHPGTGCGESPMRSSPRPTVGSWWRSSIARVSCPSC